MYLATLDCATSNPSLSSSPWIRGAPQSGGTIVATPSGLHHQYVRMIFGKDHRLTVQSKLSKDTRARQQGRGALHYSAAISKSLATNCPALSNFADCPEEPIIVSQFLPKSL